MHLFIDPMPFFSRFLVNIYVLFQSDIFHVINYGFENLFTFFPPVYRTINTK